MSNTPSNNDSKREMLPMEKTFNQWAYGGISFLAQAITGSALTYWIKHSSGRPIYDKIAKWVGPNFIEKFGKYKGAAAVEAANSFITISTMVMVGNLFLLPLKLLENKKNEIVAKWTKEDNEARIARGDAPTEEELKHQQELQRQLDNAPKQSWLSLGLGRTFALATVFTADRVMEKFGANAALEGLTKKATAGVAKALGLKKLAEWKPFGHISGLIYFDGFYSMISAAGLYVYSHFVVPPQKSAVESSTHNDAIASHVPQDKIMPTREISVAENKKRTESFAENVRASQQTTNTMQAALC